MRWNFKPCPRFPEPIGYDNQLKHDRMHFYNAAPDWAPSCAFEFFPHASGHQHPELAHAILVDQARSFGKSPALRLLLYPLAGEGLFTSEGELWKRQRKLMAPLFHAHALQSLMTTCARRQSASWTPGAELDMARQCTHITMAVVGKTLFDADTFDDADSLGASLTTALDWVNESIGSPRLVGQTVLLGAVEDALHERLPQSLQPLGEALHAHFHNNHGTLKTRRLQPFETPSPASMAQDYDLNENSNTTQRPDLLTRLLGARDGSGHVRPPSAETKP